MRYIKTAAIAAMIGAVLLPLAGCKTAHHPSAKAAARTVAASAQGRQAKARLTRCETGVSWLSKAGRRAFAACAIPASGSPAAKAKAERCLASDLIAHHFGVTRRERLAATEAALPCLAAK